MKMDTKKDENSRVKTNYGGGRVMLKNILFACLVIFYQQFWPSESHQKTVDLDFKTAVKHIEKKDFLKRMRFFQV